MLSKTASVLNKNTRQVKEIVSISLTCRVCFYSERWQSTFFLGGGGGMYMVFVSGKLETESIAPGTVAVVC